MTAEVNDFFSGYDTEVYAAAMKLRKLILAELPGITEQIDLPARMVAYCYGQKYIEMICTLIPSKKGLKLGFNRGVDLPDPNRLLEGTGKISRYVHIKPNTAINFPAMTQLLAFALKAYKNRMGKE